MSQMETATAPHKSFVHQHEINLDKVGEGVHRKIMAYDEKLMMVRVEFETGGIGSLHSHYHVQMSSVESGVFEIEIDGVKSILKQGDVFHVQSNVVHGAKCLEAGVLIDVFTPMREDFVSSI